MPIGQTAEVTLNSNIALAELAHQNGILVIVPSINFNLCPDEKALVFLDALGAYAVPADKAVIGGSPDEKPEEYARRSMYSRDLPAGGNARHLAGIPVRLYADRVSAFQTQRPLRLAPSLRHVLPRRAA